MNIDEIIKAKKFITNNYKTDLDGRISYFKAAELMAEYHQSKVKENELLHSVSVSDRTNELIGFILSSYKLLNNKTDFEQVYRAIVYKADDLKNKIEEHSR